VTKRQAIFLVIFALMCAGIVASLSPMMLDPLYKMVQTPVYDRTTGKPIDPGPYWGARTFPSLVACGVLGGIIGIGLARLLIRISERQVSKWEKLHTGDKVNVFLGGFLGLIASMPILLLLNQLQEALYMPYAIVGVTVGLAAISIYALRSMDDILPWSKGKGPARRSGVKILDTNVLIDGRIYDVARAGFLEGQIYIPGFVLDELQYIADSHDPLRRQRGRRGLDVLRHLQADFTVDVRTQDRHAPETGDEVDARLVRLARAIGADIVTNDFNLNRVASLQKVRVLNLNDLALALRPNVLPSENLELTIVREGNQPGQGVGYLEDGTMVVVENGRGYLGDTMDVVVTQVIQTERGKMIFASIELDNEGAPPVARRARRS